MMRCQLRGIVRVGLAGEVRRLVQDNELFTVVLGLAALVFFVAHRRAFRRLPDSPLLLAAYGSLFLGWIATVVEGFAWPTVFNIVEHSFYAVSGVVFGWWGWHALRRKRGQAS